MAIGSGTFTSLGGAVSDLFAAQGDQMKAQGLRIKAQGDALEGKNYDLAGQLADQNAQYTDWTTNVKAQMADRSTYQALGTATAQIANSGLATSGSALDLLHESAANGAVAKEVGVAQGNITEAGYQEQAQSYRNLSEAANFAVQGDNLAADAADKASTGATISGILKGVGAVASLFT